MSMERFLDWITGDDVRRKRELLKLRCDTKHVWHIGDSVPRDGMFLVLYKIGGRYVKAIASAEFHLGQFFCGYTYWKIDRFLTDGPVRRSKYQKVIAWAELNTVGDDNYDG